MNPQHECPDCKECFSTEYSLTTHQLRHCTDRVRRAARMVEEVLERLEDLAHPHCIECEGQVENRRLTRDGTCPNCGRWYAKHDQGYAEFARAFLVRPVIRDFEGVE